MDKEIIQEHVDAMVDFVNYFLEVVTDEKSYLKFKEIMKNCEVDVNFKSKDKSGKFGVIARFILEKEKGLFSSPIVYELAKGYLNTLIGDGK